MASRVLVQRSVAVTTLAIAVVVAMTLSALPLPPPTTRADPVATAGAETPRVPNASPFPRTTTDPTPALLGSTGTRLFDVRTGLPDGTSNSVTSLDIDPATGKVFAANEFAATVTVFDETSGAIEQMRPVGSFVQGSFPAGLLLDPLHHRLFVSISTRFNDPSGSGWLLVLNESTLATEQNVSFASSPVPPFEPTFIAYDDATDQAFVENATGGEIAVVDLATSQVSKYLACPVADCAEHGYGLVNVPQYHTLVVPTCAPSLWLVNTTNDSTRTLLTGPAIGALMAWAAFDSVDQTLWVENYSYFGSTGTFLEYNLSTLALLADVPGAPPRETGMSYEPFYNLLVATNINGSQEIATFHASNATPVATSGSNTSTSHPFFALVVDPISHVAVAGGPGNGSTIAYDLPSLAIRQVYASFPLAQPAAAVDPARNAYLVTSTTPTMIRSENDTTGASNWQSILPPGTNPVALALDAATSTAFVADGAGGQLLAYDAGTGALTHTYSLGAGVNGACALVSDPSRGFLYVGSTSPSEVLVFHVGLGVVSGTLVLPGEMPCRLALDRANGDLIVLSTTPAGSVFDLTPTQGGLLVQNATWATPVAPADVAVDASGVIYVLANSGTELVAMTAPNGTVTATGDLSGLPASALALDPTDGFLFLAASPEGLVQVFGTGTLGDLLNLDCTGPAGAIAFDDASGVLVAATATTGQVMVATLVPVPSSPTGLVATSGNNSVSAHWGPPISSGPYPVTGFDVNARPAGGAAVGLATNTLSATVENLTNGIAYDLTVAAVSTAGAGTSVASATMTPAGVPYPPTSVAVVGAGTNDLTVQWSPPETDDGAVITDYVVRYAPTSGGPASTLDAGVGLTATITGLSPGTNYTIVVTATNSVGVGHPSVIAQATTGPASESVLAKFWWVAVIVSLAILLLAIVALRIRARDRRTAPEIPSDPPPEPTTPSESPKPPPPAP